MFEALTAQRAWRQLTGFMAAGGLATAVHWSAMALLVLAWVTNFLVLSLLQQGLVLSVTVAQFTTTAVLALLNAWDDSPERQA